MARSSSRLLVVLGIWLLCWTGADAALRELPRRSHRWGESGRANPLIWGVARVPAQEYGRFMTRALPGAESALDALERVAEAGLPAQELLEEVMQRVDTVVPSDGYFVGATDPDTILSLGAGIVRDLP